jgi:MFS family permease
MLAPIQCDKEASVTETALRTQPRIYYGWIVVVASSVIFLVGSGVFFYGFGTFFNPIKNEFGWSATITAAAFTFYRLEGGVAAPIVGFLVDKLGPKRIMVAGLFVMGIGFILMSRINSIPTFYLTFILTSIGFSAGVGVVGMTAVSNWFVKKRGRALGVTMAGAGLAGIIAPLLHFMINHWGWRDTLVVVAIAVWVICIPMALLVRNRPEEYGLLPDGDAPAPSSAGRAASASTASSPQNAKPAANLEAELTWGQAFRTRTFWLLAFASGFSNLTTSGATVLVIPHLENVGVNPGIAALSITFITVGSIAGRLLGGALGDKFDKRYILAVGLTMQATGVLLLSFVHAAWMIIPFILLYAPGYGAAIPIRPAIAGQAFGRKAFGSIQGSIQGVMTFLSVPGPLLGGYIYDQTGSYAWAFIIFAVFNVLAVPCALLITLKARKSAVSAPVPAH